MSTEYHYHCLAAPSISLPLFGCSVNITTIVWLLRQYHYHCLAAPSISLPLFGCSVNITTIVWLLRQYHYHCLAAPSISLPLFGCSVNITTWVFVKSRDPGKLPGYDAACTRLSSGWKIIFYCYLCPTRFTLNRL